MPANLLLRLRLRFNIRSTTPTRPMRMKGRTTTVPPTAKVMPIIAAGLAGVYAGRSVEFEEKDVQEDTLVT